MFRSKKILGAKFKSLIFLKIREINIMSKDLKRNNRDLDGKIETFSGAQQLLDIQKKKLLSKVEWRFQCWSNCIGHVVNWLAGPLKKELGKETLFLHKDGTEMPCKIKITPTKDREGTTSAIVV